MKLAALLGVATIATLSLFAYTAPSFAEDLDDILAKGELSFAMSGGYPPFSMVDNNNEVTGFDVEIGNEIAKRLGVKGVVVNTAWDGIIAGLLSRKFDTIIGSMTITDDRLKVIDFAGPYYRAGRGVFVPTDSAINTLAELDGKTVGTILGETHEKWASEQPGWTVRTYKALPELFLEISSGRIDAMVTDSIPVAVAIKDEAVDIRQLDTPDIEGGNEGVGIALRQGNPALKDAIQGALDAMMEDGTYEAISMKWIGRDIR